MSRTRIKYKTGIQIMELGTKCYECSVQLIKILEEYFILHFSDHTSSGIMAAVLSVIADYHQGSNNEKCSPRLDKDFDWVIVSSLTSFQVVHLLKMGFDNTKSDFIDPCDIIYSRDFDENLNDNYTEREGMNKSVGVIACEIGSDVLLRFTISNSPNYKVEGEALVLAAHNGHMNIIKILLKDLCVLKDVPANDINQFFLEVCGQGYFEMARLLYENGIYKGSVESSFQDLSPIHWATRSGNLDLCIYLLEKCPGCPDIYQDCIIVAAKNGHLEIIRYIENVTGGFVWYDKWGLEAACSSGQMNVIEYFVTKGTIIDPEFLVNAFSCGHYEAAKYLMDNDVDIVEAINVSTAWHNLKCVKYLINQVIKRNPERLYEVIEYLTDYQKIKYSHLLSAGEFNLM